jgi:hypothetical protein
MSAPAVPAPAVLSPVPATLETSEDRWARWTERGRAHDRAIRQRWILGLALAGAVLLVGAGVAVGLR